MSDEVRPFEIAVENAQLQELRQRIGFQDSAGQFRAGRRPVDDPHDVDVRSGKVLGELNELVAATRFGRIVPGRQFDPVDANIRQQDAQRCR